MVVPKCNKKTNLNLKIKFENFTENKTICRRFLTLNCTHINKNFNTFQIVSVEFIFFPKLHHHHQPYTLYGILFLIFYFYFYFLRRKYIFRISSSMSPGLMCFVYTFLCLCERKRQWHRRQGNTIRYIEIGRLRKFFDR